MGQVGSLDLLRRVDSRQARGGRGGPFDAGGVLWPGDAEVALGIRKYGEGTGGAEEGQGGGNLVAEAPREGAKGQEEQGGGGVTRIQAAAGRVAGAQPRC